MELRSRKREAVKFVITHKGKRDSPESVNGNQEFHDAKDELVSNSKAKIKPIRSHKRKAPDNDKQPLSNDQAKHEGNDEVMNEVKADIMDRVIGKVVDEGNNEVITESGDEHCERFEHSIHALVSPNHWIRVASRTAHGQDEAQSKTNSCRKSQNHSHFQTQYFSWEERPGRCGGGRAGGNIWRSRRKTRWASLGQAIHQRMALLIRSWWQQTSG